MFFHDVVAALDGGRVLEHTALQGFNITIDECQRSAQFVGGIGDEIFADLLGHRLLGDVMHHEPRTAFRLGRQGRGFDEIIATRQARTVGKLDLAHDAALLFKRTLDDIGDLMVLKLLNEHATAMDASLLKKVRQRAIREFDAHLIIDDSHTLADLVE